MATTTRSTTRRRSTKTAEAGAAQHANGVNMAQTQTPAPAPSITEQAKAVQAEGNPNKPSQTNDANLVMPRINHTLLVQSIKAAGASFKAAINMELAVNIAVFHAAGNTSAASKKELYGIYKEAGYECEVGGEGKDYKTVNRRIGYAAQFFDSLEDEELTILLGEAKDEAAMQTLVGWLGTKYNFRSMNDVLLAAGVTPPSRAKAPAQAPAPAAAPAPESVFPVSATATPTGVPQQPTEGDKGVMAAMEQAAAARTAAPAAQDRRMFDDKSKWLKFTFEGATIILPVDMKTECLADLAIKLMTAANHMRGREIDVAALNAQFKEAELAH